ncbi:hypothetical protein D3C75_1161600 [compost metagenome]
MDDSARPRPSTMAAGFDWPNSQYASRPSTTALRPTCSEPTPNSARRMLHKRRGDSSRPMTNSSITTPISDRRATLSGLFSKPNTDGPMRMPASR